MKLLKKSCKEFSRQGLMVQGQRQGKELEGQGSRQGQGLEK